jgi:hypothetical protein
MMFLLRLTFWIMLICLLLPGSREDNRRLLSSAEKTVDDVRGFCGRNPDVCNDARATMTSLLARLKSGTELLQVWLSDTDKKIQDRAIETPASKSSPHSGPEPRYQNSDYPAQQTVPKVAPQYRDSLNPADKEVPWRGPSRL